MDDPNPLVIAGRVAVTPQGSLRITENVILERSASGRLRTFNPENLTVGEGMEVVQNHSRRNLFPNNDEDDDIFEPRLAQMLEVDSASEVEDDDMTVEELQEILEEDEDLVPEEDEVGEEFVWSEDFSSFRGSREEFHESAGPKIEGIDPLHIFSQIWDQPLMESIKNETNKYAWETIAPLYEEENGLPPNSRLNNWVETSVSELYRLIAVIVLMAMCVRGRIDEYWSTGILGMPGFRRLMQRDRFLLLMRHLHFVDNDSIAGCRGSERRLAKIRPLLDYLNMKFKTSYTPHQEVSIDESLLLWKGHLSWIQCIRSKAARFGIKSYELCESITGYVIKMIIYTGKGTSVRGSLFGFESLTAKTVLQLFTEYLGKGYTLFMDNFYNSLALTRFLKRNKTDVVGTLNRRRINCPPAIKAVNEKRVPRGTVVSQHCGDISVVAWKDVKLVTTVSTYHTANMAPGRRAGRIVEKPEVILDYNSYMGGVDLKDQKLSMYLLERKRGIKWYIKVFRRLLNISILNSYIIYCSNIGQQKKLTHRQYRYKLAEQLYARFGDDGTSATIRQQQGNLCARLDKTLDHFPEHKEIAQERTARQVRFQRGRCVRCSAKKERRDTNIQCSQCKVFLCVGQCWREFHSLESL